MLVNDPEEIVRSKIAKKLSFQQHPHILTRYATDSNLEVRENVAKNLTVPIHILKQLANDESSTIRNIVDSRRIEGLEKYIESLDPSRAYYAKLLLPSFTGFEDTFDNAIKLLVAE